MSPGGEAGINPGKKQDMIRFSTPRRQGRNRDSRFLIGGIACVVTAVGVYGIGRDNVAGYLDSGIAP